MPVAQHRPSVSLRSFGLRTASPRLFGRCSRWFGWLAASLLFVASPLAADDTQADSWKSGSLKLERMDLLDFRGREWTLEDFGDDQILVVAFLGTECPLAKHYSIKLNDLARELEGQGVGVVGVMSNRQDSLEEIAAFANRQSLEFPILKDAGNQFADAMQAERTPEVLLFDASRSLRYRGRVDDQYGIGYVRDAPRRKDLRVAIDEVLAGRSVTQPQTRAVGCIIGRTKKSSLTSDVTFGSHVAEILNKNCVKCHRSGEIAPFELTEYDEVAGWADMIAEVVREGRMPPWHATSEHETFANDRSLTEEEKSAIYEWAEAGAPAGDLSDLPTPPARLTSWQLPKEPDLVVPVSPKPFQVPATGAVRYQYFAVDPEFEEDVWLKAAELKPGNREVVHHILVFAVPKGQRRGLDGARGFLEGYVPGARVKPWPKGHAKRVPAGSELIFQVHYTPIGTPQTDQSSFGMVFADPDDVTHEVITSSAVQPRLRIPPGDANYTVDATGPSLPEQATLLSFSPHMHVRGKSYRYELRAPGREQETILDIPAYDFNWQTTYILSQPRSVSSGTRVFCTAVFDNSDANLNNPDPTATVRWGDQTWDEMMIGYYHYSVPRQSTDSPNQKSFRQRAREAIERAARLRKFDDLDTDGDGRLSRRETPKTLKQVFDELDRDHDRVLTREEASANR